MLLPSLVFDAEVKGFRVLKVWWQHNGFIASFTGQLNSEIPRVKGNKGEVEVLSGQMFLCKRIEAVDCIAESPCIADMFPSKSCQTR